MVAGDAKVKEFLGIMECIPQPVNVVINMIVTILTNFPGKSRAPKSSPLKTVSG
jgi:hypothetical protein